MRKNKKIALSALYLAAALSLASCNKENKEKYLKEPAITYEQQKQDKEDKEYIESLCNNENSFSFINVEIEGVKLRYYSLGTLYIYKDEKDNDKFSKDFYYKINLIIKEFEIEEIYFWKWKNEIDFSKLNLKKIKSLAFDNFSGIFDSTKVDLENIDTLEFFNSNDATFNFSGITSKIKTLHFSDTSLDIVKNVFSNCNFEDVYVYWFYKKNKNLKPSLEYLVENDIMIGNFSIFGMSNKPITNEEFKLLSKLNATYLDIDSSGFKKPVNLDLTLNDNIKYIYFNIYNYNYDNYNNYNNYKNSEIGNIKIKSNNNKDLSLRFSHMNITNKTHFSVPNSSFVDFSSLDCKSIRSFKELENVKELSFKETNGPSTKLIEDMEGRLWYSKDKNSKYVDSETSEPIKLIHDYKDVLKKLSYYYKLSKLRDKLNVSKNEIQEYYYEKSIGDFVNLVSDDVTILKNGKKTTSYYGTSIIRCISSIVLQKGDKVVVVDNMEDYEKYKYKKFKVKGYNLVNEYSLNKNGTLTTELCVKDSDIKLVYTPFN